MAVFCELVTSVIGVGVVGGVEGTGIEGVGAGFFGGALEGVAR